MSGTTVRNSTVRLKLFPVSRGTKPVLFLHGLTFSADTFGNLTGLLDPEIQCWSTDFRGHGQSDRTGPPYLFSDLVNDTIAVIREGIKTPTTLFGHSLGGAVALAVAARAPEWVTGLIVSDNFLTRDRYQELREQPLVKSLWVQVEQVGRNGWSLRKTADALAAIQLPVADSESPVTLSQFPGNSQAFFRLWARSLIRCDPLVARMLFCDDNVAEFDGETFLRRLQCPMLLLQADPEAGALLSDADVEVARQFVPHFPVLKFEGASHFMHLHKPLPTAEAISSFVRGMVRQVPGRRSSLPR